VEEWGLSLGEDACQFDDEPEPDSYQSDDEVEHCEPAASNNVDMVVDKLVEDLVTDMEEEEHPRRREKAEDEVKLRQPENVNNEEDQDNVPLQEGSSASRVPESKVVSATQSAALDGEPTMVINESDVSFSNRVSTSGERQRLKEKVHCSKRPLSCPPGATRSVISGPWSL
ncbi:hypothetical protein A2U01_0049464, partial [Trifolium medium]|nr:hypothetical protein [Trifolium medium]